MHEYDIITLGTMHEYDIITLETQTQAISCSGEDVLPFGLKPKGQTSSPGLKPKGEASSPELVASF